MPAQSKRPPSQRQLRVGEEIRHALSEVFYRGETHAPELDGISITVSEVRISPDLKNATAYCTPLAGTADPDKVIQTLNDLTPLIRRQMNKKIVLKYSPRLYFKLDKSFDAANRINVLLQKPEVQKDIAAASDDESNS